MPHVVDIFAKNASARMQHLGLTQLDLGKLLNKDQSVVSKALSGDINPTLETMEKWADALRVPVSWLVSDESSSSVVIREPSKEEIAERMLTDYLGEGKLLTAITLLLRNASRESFLDGALAVLSVGIDSTSNQSEHKAGSR